MNIKLVSLLAMVVVALLVVAGIVIAAEPDPPATPPGRSENVRITVGDTTVTGVAKGDVVHEGRRSTSPDGEAVCDDMPSVSIEMSGSVSRVKVGLAENTCNLVVRDLVFNDNAIPSTPHGSELNTQAGWE